MSKTLYVLLATTAIALIISGFLWVELNAERKLARRNQPDVLLTPELPATGRSTGSEFATPGPQDRPPDMPPPQLNGNAEAVPPTTVFPADYAHAQLISMEFTRPRYSLEGARRTIAKAYPELRAGAGLSDEEVETLAGLMASGAYPEESEKALGASTYQRWMDYRRTIDADRTVDALQKRLSNAPLNEYQVGALARVLQDEQRWHDEQSPRQPPTASDRRSKLENELRAARLEARRRANVVDRARAFLTEEQISALQSDPNAELRNAFQAALEVELDKDGR